MLKLSTLGILIVFFGVSLVVPRSQAQTTTTENSDASGIQPDAGSGEYPTPDMEGPEEGEPDIDPIMPWPDPPTSKEPDIDAPGSDPDAHESIEPGVPWPGPCEGANCLN